MPSTVEFGFLTKDVAVDLAEFSITPLPEFATRKQDLEATLHEDGHYYPPSSYKVRMPKPWESTPPERIPNTDRPALLFFLPSSHQLTVHNPIDENPSTGDASFLVQLLAYVYGTRLQIERFQFDGRIPVRYPTHHIWIGKRGLHSFLQAAYTTWRHEQSDNRLRLTNILYMHSKAPSYEWTWEQYLIEYLVTDAIYDYTFRTLVTTAVAHSVRIHEVCSRYGLHRAEPSVIDGLVAIRNNLFHEAQWEGERPGYRISQAAYDSAHLLRSLNQHAIAGLFGGVNSYATGNWEDWRNMHEFA